MGIIFGILGILGGGQLIMMPKMMEMQREMFLSVKESIENQEVTNPQQIFPKKMFETMKKMLDTPDWFDTYCIIAGIVAFFVSGFYVFASIQLLQTKPTAIKIFYSAVSLTIGFSILKSIVAMVAMSFMGMAMMMGGTFGIVINVVLLIVVATGNKEAFILQEA